MPVVTVSLTTRERAALAEIRAVLGFRSDAAALCAGLYKLAQWIDPAVDPTLFRLDRAAARRLVTPRPPPRRKAISSPSRKTP